MRKRVARLLLVVACGSLLSCNGSPVGLGDQPLANGRWTGEGACLSVADAGCDLAVGCGHGQFPRPTIRADGTFDVDGTYRVEIGPISVDAAPAHFSGSVAGSRLIVTVVPSGSIPAATYSMTSASPGACPIPCV